MKVIKKLVSSNAEVVILAEKRKNEKNGKLEDCFNSYIVGKDNTLTRVQPVLDASHKPVDGKFAAVLFAETDKELGALVNSLEANF